MPMTSAATPAFQHRPSPSVQPARKYGMTCGRSMQRMRRSAGILNTRAISSRLSSRARMPESTLVYITGNTITSAMNTDRLREPNQISARMMNDATGTVFIASTSGASSSSTRLKRAASAASSVPSAAASRKPPRMRSIEPSSDDQKRVV